MCFNDLGIFPDEETKQAYINRIKAHKPIDAYADLSMTANAKALTLGDILEAKQNFENNNCSEPIYSAVVIKKEDYKKLLGRIDNTEITNLPNALYGMPVYTYKTEEQKAKLVDKLQELNKSIIDVELI